MDKLKKIKELIKKIKSGTVSIKDLSPKEQFEILKQAIMTKVKAFLISLSGWIILGCLIIGAILLCFALLLELFKLIAGFFGAVWNGLQYIFIGTKANVDADDIANVRKELDDMGVDFDEIGYIGAIKEMGGVDDVQEYLDEVDGKKSTMINRMKEVEEKQKKISDAKDEYESLQKSGTATSSQLQAAKDKIEDLEKDLSKFEDKFIEFYIRKYLEVQEQTGAAVNNITFSDDKGAIRVKVNDKVSGQATLWEKFKNFFTGSYTVKNDGGKFTTRIANKDIDITDEVYQIYMPWQYPFTFHNETLSPDVGYLVATLGKYHYLEIMMDIEEALVIEATENDDGEITGISAQWVDDAEYAVKNYKVVRHLFPLITEASTWYSIDKYTYTYNGVCSEVLKYNWNKDDVLSSGFDSTSKSQLLGKFTFDEDDIYYTGGGSNQSISSLGFRYLDSDDNKTYYYKKFVPDTNGMINTEENVEGQNEMSKILLPVPEFDENGELLNESSLPRYYIANRGEMDESGNYTGALSILNVKTNADAIVKSIAEIYKKDDVTKEQIAGDNEQKGVDNLSADDYEQMAENTEPFDPDYSIKMIRDIIEFFGDNKLIDGSGTFAAGEYADLVVNWFLEDGETSTANISTGNPATITTTAGTRVNAPITGTVTSVSGDTIEITKYGTYEEAVNEGLNVAEADKVPIKIIRLTGISNISVSVGQTVTSGSTSIGEVGTSGKITFTDIRGDMTMEDASKVNQELTTAQASQNAQFILPLAKGTFRITSEFGPRTNPVTGQYQKAHGALDMGTPQGSNIYAAADGVAIVPAFNEGGYGNYIIIDHGGGYKTLYAHMKSKAIVSSGASVKKGQVIGYVGSTGRSTGPHLHFEVRVNDTKVDPRKYIGQFLSD